jgi:hypothetical protein
MRRERSACTKIGLETKAKTNNRFKTFLENKLGKVQGPASAVKELRTTEREDPGSTPDEGS